MWTNPNAWNNTYDYFQEKYMREKQDFLAKLEKTAPVECEFKIGDVVTFTNDYEVSFYGKVIVGFSNKENMFNGRFIHFDGEAYWFPVRPDQLKKFDSSTELKVIH